MAFQAALNLPASVVVHAIYGSCLTGDSEGNEKNARRVLGTSYKFLTSGYAESKWLNHAIRDAYRIEATLLRDMDHTVRIVMQFYRRVERAGFGSLEILVDGHGEVVSVNFRFRNGTP